MDQFVGAWKAEEEPYTTLTVSVEDGQLKVVLEGEDGDFKLDCTNVQVMDGDKLCFDVDMDGLSTFSLTREGGKLSGGWTDGAGDSGPASYVICSS